MLKDYGKIISQNLKRISYENDRTQADICRDLHLNDSTVSSWFNGSRIPRMDKVDMLCHYFNCKRADLMEPYTPKNDEFSPEVQDVARLLEQLKHDDLIEIRGEIKGIIRSYRENALADLA